MKLIVMTSNLELFKIFYSYICSKVKQIEITLITKNILFKKICDSHNYKFNLALHHSIQGMHEMLSKSDFNSKIISFNSSYIFTNDDLNNFIFPILNFHTGLIPENRGRSPLFWDILEFKEYSFGTLHAVSEEIDKGRILQVVSTRINENDDPNTISKKLFLRAIEENIFAKWLQKEISELDSIPEVDESGSYKRSFKLEDNYNSHELNTDNLMRLWRCYKIWGKISINNFFYNDISLFKKTKEYIKINTVDGFIYCKPNKL